MFVFFISTCRTAYRYKGYMPFYLQARWNRACRTGSSLAPQRRSSPREARRCRNSRPSIQLFSKCFPDRRTLKIITEAFVEELFEKFSEILFPKVLKFFFVLHPPKLLISKHLTIFGLLEKAFACSVVVANRKQKTTSGQRRLFFPST